MQNTGGLFFSAVSGLVTAGKTQVWLGTQVTMQMSAHRAPATTNLKTEQPLLIRRKQVLLLLITLLHQLSSTALNTNWFCNDGNVERMWCTVIHHRGVSVSTAAGSQQGNLFTEFSPGACWLPGFSNHH